MRLLLRLKSENDQKDVSLEYHKSQGFVYSLLAESGFPLLHDKSGFKPFCFSNIFPFGDMKAGDVRHFRSRLPVTPSSKASRSILPPLTGSPDPLGDCSFSLKGVRIIDTQINQGPVKIICATPILLRIPENNYDLYAVPEEERRPRYACTGARRSRLRRLSNSSPRTLPRNTTSHTARQSGIILSSRNSYSGKPFIPGTLLTGRVTGRREACGNFPGATWTMCSGG